MDKPAQALIDNLTKRNIRAAYCDNRSMAAEELLSIIPHGASVGISGSKTLEQLGIVSKLEARGNKVFNQYKDGVSREEGLKLRQQGTGADYYLTSANAVSYDGELVFFSGYGQRIAGISNAKNVIVVCGINKITPDINTALKRAREYVTPLNCKRLNWNSACLDKGLCRREVCFSPEYKRMCCQVLIIEAEVTPGRLKFILVGENLGF
ncbi:MAG: lactate utilization protein [Candidatus Omnitrophica bacterium CG08_land_8_20_14_0_20_41_16]|nr:MAG: lactate utilization protein [Candidatus Omnitrophica bacterium CG08_land_8_20_14_0_20_41_16]